MKDAQTLTRHRDIKNWVTAHSGQPGIARIRNHVGELKSRLCLRFERAEAPVSTPSLDDGMSPISWSAWLAELDRQQLALKVSNQKAPVFEFVERQALN